MLMASSNGTRLVGDAVGVHLAAPDVAAVGELVEPAAHDGLARGVHALDAVAEGLDAVALDDAVERGGAGADADDQRVDVARDHLRDARVGGRHPVDVGDQAAAGEQLDAREDRALLEDVDRVGRVRVLAPDVQPVGLDRAVADQLAVGAVVALQEDRHDDRDVLRVRARAVGHVVQDDVAGLERVLAADGLDRLGHAERHGAHERRQRRGLGEQADVAVVERGGEVEDLVDDRAERRADQRALHLLGGGVERLADDLGGDGVGAARVTACVSLMPGLRR